VQKSALVPFSPSQMYDLVNDVEAYPEFVPWCSNAKLLSRTEEELCGRIEFKRAGLHHWFATCNRLQENRRIDIRLEEGPFKHLEGVWVFTPLGEEACKVELTMEFEFAGRLISAAFGPVFNQVASTLVSAFVKRAHEVYGG
jgi:ribosome-associated toxin RatA of RatAB toxin-antitoxin module